MIFMISKYLRLRYKNIKQKLSLNKNSVFSKTLSHLFQKIKFYEENQLVNCTLCAATINNTPDGTVFVMLSVLCAISGNLCIIAGVRQKFMTQENHCLLMLNGLFLY